MTPVEFIRIHSDETIAIITLLIAIGEIITRLTPSDRDNTVLSIIKELFDLFVPNRTNEKGTFFKGFSRKVKKKD